MKPTSRFNIYECFNSDSEGYSYICDGHIDSEAFRDKCYRDYFVKPMVIRHQWQALRKTPAQKRGKRFVKGVTTTVSCNPWEKGATPITIGLI